MFFFYRGVFLENEGGGGGGGVLQRFSKNTAVSNVSNMERPATCAAGQAPAVLCRYSKFERGAKQCRTQSSVPHRPCYEYTGE